LLDKVKSQNLMSELSLENSKKLSLIHASKRTQRSNTGDYSASS
jgi:hypothetical protein